MYLTPGLQDTDHPQLIQSLITDLLAECEEATNWLAPCLGQTEEPTEERRARVAEALVRSSADQLLELWSRVQKGKIRLSPRAAELVEALIHLAIPTTCESNDPQRIRQSDLKTQSNVPPLQLVACHQTLAEIAVAAADRRRTLFRRQRSSTEYPGGQGLLARVFAPGPEQGRDPDGRQAARDFLVELAGQEEYAFEEFGGKLPDFLHGFVGEAPTGAFNDRPETGEPDPKLVEWINLRLRDKAQDQAEELDAGGRCGYTFYAVVETPPDLPSDVRAHQDRILQGLKGLFPQIAFLRLGPPADWVTQIRLYSRLCDLLWRSAQDQNP